MNSVKSLDFKNSLYISYSHWKSYDKSVYILYQYRLACCLIIPIWIKNNYYNLSGSPKLFKIIHVKKNCREQINERIVMIKIYMCLMPTKFLMNVCDLVKMNIVLLCLYNISVCGEKNELMYIILATMLIGSTSL